MHVGWRHAGSDAVIATLARLSLGSGSAMEKLTLAVLLMRMLLATVQFTWATSVIVAEPPPANDAKVTVRLLPVPPHVPPAVAAQDTNVVAAGR
jgi:hypothetical protein